MRGDLARFGGYGGLGAIPRHHRQHHPLLPSSITPPAALQLRMSSERQREELQRRVAALDSQLAISQARLEDAGNEANSLGQRLAMERNRVTELEVSGGKISSCQ